MSQTSNDQNKRAVAEQALALVQELAEQLQPRLASHYRATLDSQLDRDLGLDSLSRLELIARLEQHFSVRLPQAVFGEAETPRDLLRAILAAEPDVPRQTMTRTLPQQDSHTRPPAQATAGRRTNSRR